MATVASSNDDFGINDDDNHLEIFCLVWLDASANGEDIRDTDQKLRSIINHLRKFQDVKQCQKYIEQKSQEDRLVLIVSGRSGQEIVPCIHKLRQVTSIYVYCMDKKLNEKWASKFTKVKGVVVELAELVSRIKTDHKIQKKVEEPLAINMFNADKSTTELKGRFVFSQILIDCLLRLKYNQTDKNELITWCKNEYKGNRRELAHIHEFQEDYSSDKALWWYTRDSFLYKTVNAALRRQNIHMIFLFRAFILDIHHQLQHYQPKKPLRVYRSQMISGEELKKLQQCLGQYISINSFFSTSIEYSTAASFLSSSNISEDLKRVVFYINADPKTITTKPFADISGCSEFTDEEEVLFMLGSIFHLDRIDRGDDEIWIIQMTLYDDDEHDLKKVLMHMKQQFGSGETNLQTLGKILSKMGEFDLAERYFKRLLGELGPDDPLLGSLYEDLADLASLKQDFDMSVEWRQKSIEIKEQNLSATNSIMTVARYSGSKFIKRESNIFKRVLSG